MTTKTQATPGPWKAEHSGYGDATVIAKCGWKNKDGSKFEPVIVQRTSWENARLIAAAPDLLQALRYCAMYLRLPVTKRDGGSYEALSAETAICKATGEA